MKQIVLLLFVVFFFTQTGSTSEFLHFEFLYPKPNASRVSPHATVIFRFENLSPRYVKNLDKSIHVSDENGVIAGSVRVASDQRTIIFQPNAAFQYGATIAVRLQPILSHPANITIAPVNYSFRITHSAAVDSDFVPDDERFPQPMSRSLNKAASGHARIMPNGVSVPSDFPHINVTTNSAPGDGFIFLNNRGRGTPYNIIFDNDGSPVWYLRTDDRRRDFKVQRNGSISMLVRSGGHRFRNFDKNFNVLRDYSAVDGYSTDEHECVITEDGHVLLIGLREETVDMRAYVAGGQRNATVRETIIQEFTPEGDKIFEWRAWDHFEDVLEFLELEHLQGGYIRFPHMNAIDIDDDGHILLSSRHLSEVTKINRQTGEFIWRLGGPANEFDFVNDDLGGFKNQHAILSLGNNRYTLFDNGTARQPSVSRAVEYVLDPEKKTATLVWEYRNPPGTEYSHYMGNCHRLPNGNTLINWAVSSRPKATEVTPSGEVVYEMNWVSSDECYRAFRLPWDGVVEKPALFVEQMLDNINLIFNKFGDTDVHYYNIYADQAPNASTVIDTSKKTMKALTPIENNKPYYVRVAAVYADGSVSEFSNEERVLVQKVERGVNLIPNGDFSQGKTAWIFELQGSGDAEWDVVDGVAHFKIQNGGSPHHNVQLRQNAMPLVTGEKYIFEFDAWADAPKTIEAKVGMDQGPYTNYSGIGLSVLSRAKKRFAYEFTMTHPADANGRVVFNVGDSDADVYLENISLKIVSLVDIDGSATKRPNDFYLGRNYPNPFNAGTSIPFAVPSRSRVKLELFDMLGRSQLMIVHSDFAAGRHSVNVDASSLSSGIYLYRLTAFDMANKQHFTDVQKMMLVK